MDGVNPAPSRLRRRRFLAALASAGAGVGLYTWLWEPHWMEIVERDLPIANLPAGLEGRRLVQLSDLHVGAKVDDSYLVRTFERVNQLVPEIVVYTGDLTSSTDRVPRSFEKLISKFPRGRAATCGVLGNHDYGHNWSHGRVADEISSVARHAGVKILRNGVTEARGLQIAGLDDIWAGRFKPGKMLSNIQAEGPALVLSHNPDTADEPVWDGYSGWILSGHTHGGQCKPPFLPAPLLPVKNRRYTAGEFELSGGRRLYINRGVGHLLKVRFNVRPEVTVFRMLRAAGR